MNRRTLLHAAAVAPAMAALRSLRAAEPQPVVTVTGPIPPSEMGTTLIHEHVLVDFIGADQVRRDRYSADTVFAAVLPHLQRVKELGCRTLVECTPAYIGRDPALLARLSRASGVQILTNAGYYGAVKDKFLPKHAFTETVDQLARRWTREWDEGIEGTGIRPGFIKIGVDEGPLSEVDTKLVRAAARCHLRTGLTIASHTGGGPALEQLRILREEGVSPEAFVWVHAQSEKNPDRHLLAAEQGAWISFDGIGEKSIEQHLTLVKRLRDNGHIGRVLVSHDAGWYDPGQPNGGPFRPYDTLFTRFLPAAAEAGLEKRHLHQLTVSNPALAFTVRVRTR